MKNILFLLLFSIFVTACATKPCLISDRSFIDETFGYYVELPIDWTSVRCIPASYNHNILQANEDIKVLMYDKETRSVMAISATKAPFNYNDFIQNNEKVNKTTNDLVARLKKKSISSEVKGIGIKYTAPDRFYNEFLHDYRDLKESLVKE